MCEECVPTSARSDNIVPIGSPSDVPSHSTGPNSKDPLIVSGGKGDEVVVPTTVCVSIVGGRGFSDSRPKF